MTFPSLPEATRRWVLRLYLAGTPVRDIAIRCRVSRAFITRTVQRAGVGRGVPASRIEARARRDAEIVRRREAGEPVAALATEFGLCTNRIEQITRAARRSATPTHAGELVGATAGAP